MKQAKRKSTQKADAGSVRVDALVRHCLRYLWLRLRLIKAAWTNIYDYELSVHKFGKETADYIQGQIENHIRNMRKNGVTKLYCSHGCVYELPDPNAPDYTRNT